MAPASTKAIWPACIGLTSTAMTRTNGPTSPPTITAVARDVMAHRLLLSFDAVADDITPPQVIERIVAMVPPPTPVWNAQQRQVAHGQHQYTPEVRG